MAPTKRRLTTITDFFARKQPREAPAVPDEAPIEAPVSPVADPAAPSEPERLQEEEQEPAPPTREKVRRHRDDRGDVLSALLRRELGECGGRLANKRHNPRRRLRQQVARWALGRFEASPVRLALAPDWEQCAGRLRGGEFFASCMEFDAQGVLLAVGASNGAVAIFDFDEFAHRSINVGQVKQVELRCSRNSGL